MANKTILEGGRKSNESMSAHGKAHSRVLLTADTVREMAFSEYTLALAMERMMLQ